MKIEVNISKTRFFIILGLMLLLSCGVFVYAYNSQFNNAATSAASFGHSADEVVVKMASDGSLKTVQELLQGGVGSSVGGSSGGGSHIYTVNGISSAPISTSWNMIPDMAITQTFSAGKVFVLFNSPVTYNQYGSYPVSFRVMVDGVSKKVSTFSSGDANVVWSGDISAGSHTISIDGSASASAMTTAASRSLTIITGQ